MAARLERNRVDLDGKFRPIGRGRFDARLRPLTPSLPSNTRPTCHMALVLSAAERGAISNLRVG
jgi:hypothetical protein